MDYDKILTAEDKILYRIMLLVGLIISPIGIMLAAFPTLISETSIILLLICSTTFSTIIISITYSFYSWSYEFIFPINKSIKEEIRKLKKLKSPVKKDIGETKWKNLLIKREKEQKAIDKKFEKLNNKKQKEFLISVLSESLETPLQVSIILLIIHYTLMLMTPRVFVFLLVIISILLIQGSRISLIMTKYKLKKDVKKMKKIREKMEKLITDYRNRKTLKN
jgi:Flp pilus assembly protein TadB